MKKIPIKTLFLSLFAIIFWSQLVRADEELEVATFAAGCFWCVEAAFEKSPGVKKVISGYTGGEIKNPTYKQVSSGKTKHIEAVEVHYDPSIASYDDILLTFWSCHDPTDSGGSFADRGLQYTSVIFTHDQIQKEAAEKSKELLNKSKRFAKPIATTIRAAKVFYHAEDYHQDYYKKSYDRYRRYSIGSGRVAFVAKHWGAFPQIVTGDYSKPARKVLKQKLTSEQYRITQEDGTERAFKNAYWDNTEEGIYVDIVSGEPLFSSKDKFKSGTGWPSFTQPIDALNVVEKTDYKIGYPRTEVRSRFGDSHLGHVFKDGPYPIKLRYCINSAALKFIPKKELKEGKYKKYQKLFDKI